MKVSKSAKAVKEVIAACFPAWKGRKVSIEEAATTTRYVEGGGTFYVDHYFSLDTGNARQAPTPRAYAKGESVVTHVMAPTLATALAGHIYTCERQCVVTHCTFQGKDSGITIYIAPMADRAVWQVAIDAALAGEADKARVLIDRACVTRREAALYIELLMATCADLNARQGAVLGAQS